MTQEQIREIVRITIDELTKANLLKSEDYRYILSKIDNKLYKFFGSDGGDMTDIYHALNQVSDDPYIDIIYLQYRDKKTLEWIAEYYGVDISTIKRNKKRLIYKIYEYLIRED